MYKRLKIPICILIITIFQPYTQSLRLYQLDSKEQDELIPKLKHLLGVHKSEDSGSLKNDLFERREQTNGRAEQPFGKSIFVKRIVPHGYQASNYEYDSKLNTLYRPLVRYHIRKPIDQQNRDILNDIESGQKGQDGFNDALVVLVKKDRNEDYDLSDQDREVRTTSRSDKDLLRQIQKFLNTNVRKPKGKKRKLKKRFRGLLGSLKNGNLDLRSMFVQKSGEEHDPYGPGKVPDYLKSEEAPPPKPKFTMPKYPYWNYWTVKYLYDIYSNIRNMSTDSSFEY